MYLTPLCLKGTHLLSSVLSRINNCWSRVVADVPLGTHLGLCHFLWTLRSGRLLQSCGAIIPALADCGRGGRAAGLGRMCVWALGHRAAPGCLAARGAGRRPLAGPPGMGATVPPPVTWWVAGGHSSQGVQPSIPAPMPAGPGRRSHSEARPASVRWVRSGSPCRAAWCVPKPTMQETPRCRGGCYPRRGRSWPVTKAS
jgi:hypothetical protein